MQHPFARAFQKNSRQWPFVRERVISLVTTVLAIATTGMDPSIQQLKVDQDEESQTADSLDLVVFLRTVECCRDSISATEKGNELEYFVSFVQFQFETLNVIFTFDM